MEFKLDDNEIEIFLGIMDKIKTKAKRLGFGKTFDPEEMEFVDSLHYSLIGQYEENTDKSDE